MNCVFPYIVELVIFSSYIIMQNGLPFDSFESTPWVLPVVFVFARWAHLNHVKNILCVWILLLLQIKHFELLPHRRLMALNCNVSERSQWLLFTAIHLYITLRLVFFSNLLFGLSIKFCPSCFLWKTGQFWSDSEWKFSERNFAIWVVAPPSQDRVDVFFHYLLFEFEYEVFDVFEIQVAIVQCVQNAESSNRVEILHCL